MEGILPFRATLSTLASIPTTSFMPSVLVPEYGTEETCIQFALTKPWIQL